MGNGARVVGSFEELRKEFLSFFFLSSQTSSLEENSRTPNAQGVSGNTALTEILPPYAKAQEA